MGTSGPSTPDTRALAVAAQQDGVIHYAQLRRAGLSETQVAWRVRTQRLIRLHRAVYLVGGAVLTLRARVRAALLACGRGALASHLTAAMLWGVRRERPGVIHITVAGRHPGPLNEVQVHRVRRLAPGVIRTRHGLRVTSPARTVCDLARVVPRAEVEHALQEAAVRRLVTQPELETAVRAMAGLPGAPLLRAILSQEADPGFTRSHAERRLLALIGRAGLPSPQKNVVILGHRVDAVWPDRRLIVEIDGFATHGTAAGFRRDRTMDAQLTAAGWRILRFTARQLRDEPLLVVARIAQALGPER